LENINELSTYLLIKKYQAEKDRQSSTALEIAKIIREDLKISEEVDLNSIEIQNRFSNIVLNEKKKNEKFINITAWIFIIITGLSFVGNGCGLLTKNLSLMISTTSDKLMNNSINPIIRFYIENHVLFVVISVIFSFAVFITSIGILYRSEIARKVAIIFLGIKILENFIQPLLVRYVYPTFSDMGINIPQQMADSMYKFSFFASAFLSIVFIIIYGWLIYKYTTPEIKEEFS
jgi:hypothetical protein